MTSRENDLFAMWFFQMSTSALSARFFLLANSSEGDDVPVPTMPMRCWRC